jgi:hypothetical protein
MHQPDKLPTKMTMIESNINAARYVSMLFQLPRDVVEQLVSQCGDFFDGFL